MTVVADDVTLTPPDTADDGALGPMDIRQVLAALPHRYPLLLVDRVEAIVPGKSIVALKAVSINEPFFQGHFPGRPIMPGVLIVEALAQAGGILALKTWGAAGLGKLVYFMAIQDAKFRQPVEPGVLMRLEVTITQIRAAVCKCEGRAIVDGKVVAQANFTAMVADAPTD